MTAQHAPGRMNWKRRQDGSLFYVIGDHKTGPHAQGDIYIDEDGMRRIAACWNACEGIDTEDLEAGSTSIIEKLHDQAAKAVLAQRDELLAALQVVLRDYAAAHDIGDIEMQPAIYQARAAIQKATQVGAHKEGD